MSDRSELALQLTDAILAAHTAVQRAGDRAFRAYGLSHRAHAVLVAVDVGGPDGARPKEIAAQLRVSRAAATTFIQRLNTAGGLAPSTGCASSSDVGREAFMPYTADYFFYKKAD